MSLGKNTTGAVQFLVWVTVVALLVGAAVAGWVITAVLYNA